MPSEPSIQSVAIAKIRMDGGTQPRAQLFEEVVTEYAEDMQQGAIFPPVIVYYDGKEYWLADGFHRVRAREAIGSKEVTADVRLGTQRDAVLYAVGANAAHGLRRTNADKHRAVRRLLRDKEWMKWSDREIARRCGVANSFVGRIRKDLSVPEEQTSHDAEELDLNSSVRLAKRGGTIFEMDTTNIRDRPQAEQKKSTKRSRAKKQPVSPKLLEEQPIEAEEGDTWKLGKSHYLFCGDASSSKFLKLFPSEVALLLYFPRQREDWTQAITLQARSTLLFHTFYGEDIDLKNLRKIIENCLSTTTDADDSIVVVNLADPLLFILMESLFCSCYCAEPDPQRCTDALTAWAAINQTVKKLST